MELTKRIGTSVKKKVNKKVKHVIHLWILAALLPFLIVLLLYGSIIGIVVMIAGDDSGSTDATAGTELTGLGAKDIPAQYIPIYQGAAKKYGINWILLAAIHKIETNFGSGDVTSSAGAIGPMQFMPKTWIGWGYPGNPSLSQMSNINLISKYGGYGVDGNGDGKADPTNVADAVYTAAKYLAANGAGNDISGAIFAYNHANWYVSEVIGYFDSWSQGGFNAVNVNGSVPQNLDGVPMTQKARGMFAVATKYNGNSYSWGSAKPPNFDCSGLVQYAFLNGAGISLPRTAAEQYSVVQHISAAQVKPGDLVFLSYGNGIEHVGIMINNDEMFDAQDAGIMFSSMNWALPYVVGYGRVPGLGN